jgi:sporulation protein YlmC with PRC-barrel domain
MSEHRDTDNSQSRVLPKPRVMSVNSLSKNRVTNMNGEDLGRIEDIMVDLETGRIAFVVLSTGGFIGREARLYAIPWEALTLSLHDKKYILNITRETLANAPSFSRSNLPDSSNLAWLGDVYHYYGYEPYWKD